MDCLTSFITPQLETIHVGKVRDSVRINDATRLIVVTDRISAFNKKIKTPIPHKGAVLNSIANFWFSQTKHIIDNHVIKQIDDSMTLVKEATPIRVEMVVRGYLTGSMWRGYESGKRAFSGTVVPDGLVKNQAFEQPILTPTTKDDDDTEINEEQIIQAGLVSDDMYQLMKEKALALFSFGSSYLLERGIVLVDTKYEFGILDGELTLIDEMHTPDSSRFWSKEDYDSNPSTAEQIDKEFVRQWMLANKIDGEVPTVLSDEVVVETSKRYREILKIVTGSAYQVPHESAKERMLKNLCANDLMYPTTIHIVHASGTDSEFINRIEGQCKNNKMATNRVVESASTYADVSVYVNSLDHPIVLAIGVQDDLQSSLKNLGLPLITATTDDTIEDIMTRLGKVVQ